LSWYFVRFLQNSRKILFWVIKGTSKSKMGQFRIPKMKFTPKMKYLKMFPKLLKLLKIYAQNAHGKNFVDKKKKGKGGEQKERRKRGAKILSSFMELLEVFAG
jgi:hypothetical protein